MKELFHNVWEFRRAAVHPFNRSSDDYRPVLLELLQAEERNLARSVLMDSHCGRVAAEVIVIQLARFADRQRQGSRRCLVVIAVADDDKRTLRHPPDRCPDGMIDPAK